ncbi:guanine deaminase [Reyranella sp. MMS21-HV4-11]|uniref:Guanine deaminase n=1 Tax=Reyranella humidisoli TaxID=2849149 RepID=A0ABS6IEV7_9HYPH|nr:guanine deaminase [Reyranella sp. MMS21-HV4-11]MBU8872773.1 guanine deaminase [Reyranella sp. MMS21-HV4-11]
MSSLSRPTALRGPALTFSGDPFRDGLDRTMVHEPDAIVAMQDGHITHFGPAARIAPLLPPGTEIRDFGKDALISAGFVDTHVHFPQTPMIASFGTQLLDWLERYTFPTELKFADRTYTRQVTRRFLQESLRNGITTSCVYCTVHAHSADILFEEAEALGLRLAAGKVLMDCNAPEALRDTAQSAYDDSLALIRKWHGRGRLLYAITPRFACTSSREQLAVAGALWREHPDCLMQTHIAETEAEVAWIKELFPERSSYLDVYDHYGLCRKRAVFGHGIWLGDDELQRLHEADAAIAHCPTSNFFLGSGMFDITRAIRADRPVRVGLGTDIGAGTSFSILQTLNEAYKAAQLNRHPLSAAHAYYLATRGSAAAMHLEDKVGSIAPGMEADLVVLDMRSTPLIAFRMDEARDFAEQLFIQMILGDDRAVQATYVAGRPAYAR